MFERFLNGINDNDKSKWNDTEHLHLISIGHNFVKFNVLFCAEVDSIDRNTRELVEIKFSNHNEDVKIRTMFQMISNGSTILCYGKSGTQNNITNVYKKELHEVKKLTHHHINKMEYNIIKNMKNIKKHMENNEELYSFCFSHNSIIWTKENIRNHILPNSQVLNELLHKNIKEKIRLECNKKKERTTEIKSTKATYHKNDNNAEGIEDEGAQVPTKRKKEKDNKMTTLTTTIPTKKRKVFENKNKSTETKEETINNNAANFAISCVIKKMKKDMEIQNNDDDDNEYDDSDYSDDFMKDVNTKSEIPYSEDEIRKFIKYLKTNINNENQTSYCPCSKYKWKYVDLTNMMDEDKCEYNKCVSVHSLMQHSEKTSGYLHLGIYNYLHELNKKNTKKITSKKEKKKKEYIHYDTWNDRYRNERRKKNNYFK